MLLKRRRALIPPPSFERIYWHPVYKYRLTENHRHVLRTPYPPLRSPIVIAGRDGVDYVRLDPDGVVTLHAGFCWDGATKAFDTIDFVRGSCIHDALGQPVATGLLPWWPWKGIGDRELYQVLREDGMPAWRAWYVRAAVMKFGGVTAPFRGVRAA